MVLVCGIVVVIGYPQSFPPRLVRVAGWHGRMIPLRRPVPSNSVDELLVSPDGDRETVEPDGPLDSAQHQVMAGPDHIDPGGQDAVVRASRTAATVEEELPDLLSQSRALGRAECSRTALGGTEELGGQQFLVGDMPERNR